MQLLLLPKNDLMSPVVVEDLFILNSVTVNTCIHCQLYQLVGVATLISLVEARTGTNDIIAILKSFNINWLKGGLLRSHMELSPLVR